MSVQNNTGINYLKSDTYNGRPFDNQKNEYYLWGPIKNGARVYIVSIDKNFVAYYARFDNNDGLILDPRYFKKNPDIYVISNSANTKQLRITQEDNLYSVVGRLDTDNNLVATMLQSNDPQTDADITSFTIFDPQNTVVVPSVKNVDFRSQATNIDGIFESSAGMAGVPIILTGNSKVLRFRQYEADPGNYKINDGLDSNCFPHKILMDGDNPLITETRTVHFVPVDWINLSQSCERISERNAYLYEQQWAISRYLNLNPSKAAGNKCAVVRGDGGGIEGFTYELMCRRGHKIDYCHGNQAECGTCLGNCSNSEICLINSDGMWGCETVTGSGEQDDSIWSQPWYWAILIIGGIGIFIALVLIVAGIRNYNKYNKNDEI